jgi:hypothetical protein
MKLRNMEAATGNRLNLNTYSSLVLNPKSGMAWRALPHQRYKTDETPSLLSSSLFPFSVQRL